MYKLLHAANAISSLISKVARKGKGVKPCSIDLLTGSTPFEKDTLRTAGFDELRRIIREVEPPRPSARVSTLQAADLSTVCDRRNVEPRKLSQQLRGELDWIVMKAMDKDRDRRYATVNDLAADVERYLHDEPVQACPPSVAYRFTKFARRNQVALVTSALVALALMVGTGVSVWQALRATNAELAAITERDEKEQLALRATNAEQQTAKALLKAQERLQFGRQAVDDMYTQFAEKWLAQQTELTQVQKQFLEKALAFYQRLATEEGDDPTVLFEAARAEYRVGDIQRRFWHHAEAETAYRRAIELLAQLPREADDSAKYTQELAKVRRCLGRLLGFTGRPQEEEQEQRLALDLFRALNASSSDGTQYQSDVALSYHELGKVLWATGKDSEAQEVQRRSLEIWEKLASEHPQVPDYRSQVGAGLNNIAAFLIVRRNWEEARQVLERAVVHQKAAVEIIPRNGTYQTFLSSHLRNLTQVQLALGDQVAAARTAEDFAHNVNAPGRSLVTVVFDCELVIIEAEATRRPDYDPQRRESQLAASVLLFKTVIPEAIQRASDDPDQFHIADLLTTAPEPLRDPELALKLARRAVELKPGDVMCQQSLGWALWRSGDYRGSIEAIGKAANGGESNFVLAMTQWQLGEKTEARTIFDGGSDWLKGYERCEEALKQCFVKYPLPTQLKRLQAEAAALLGVTPPAVEPAPAPAAKVEEVQELPKTTPAPEAAKEEEKPQ